MRRTAHILLALSTLALVAAGLGSRFGIRKLGGDFLGDPEALDASVSVDARRLIDAAYAGLDAERTLDYHVHLLGVGAGGTGTWVNPNMQSWLHPVQRMRFAVYLSAAGIADLARADSQYVDRLVRLARASRRGMRYGLLAFDYTYHPDGTRDLEGSEFHVPNARVFELAEQHPDLFVPILSVHPYRPDAVAELRRWAARGGRRVKWLPNAMGIDASRPALDRYYAALRELDLTLLTHVGEEGAVEAGERQQLGNPLLFRRALDQGVRVIMAHCASLGLQEDLDHPGRRVPAFDLFLRLLDDPRYEGLLYGEISAMLQVNRLGAPLTTLLRRTDLHPRLVNGSDYPLPAVNVVIQTRALAAAGYIDRAERAALNEIYAYNPLLFDFVTKRTLRHPVSGARFPPEIFTRRIEAAPAQAPS